MALVIRTFFDLLPEIRDHEIYSWLDDISKMVYDYVFHHQSLSKLSYGHLVDLLRCRHQLFTFFSTFNRFIVRHDFLGLAAAKAGNLKMLQQYNEKNSLTSFIYFEAISGGSLQVIQWLYDPGQLEFSDINSDMVRERSYEIAGRDNNWEVIKWLTQHCFDDHPRLPHPACIGATQSGNLGFLQFLIERGYPICDAEQLISPLLGHASCQASGSGIFTWLTERGLKPSLAVYRSAVKHGNISIIQLFLREMKNKLKLRMDRKYFHILEEAAEEGHLQTLQFIAEQKLCPIGPITHHGSHHGSFQAIEESLARNLSEIIAFLKRPINYHSLANSYTARHSSGHRTADEIYYIAEGANNGDHLPILEWLHQTKSIIPEDPLLSFIAVDSSADECFAWLLDHNYTVNQVTLTLAICKGNLSYVKKLVSKGLVLDKERSLLWAIAGCCEVDSEATDTDDYLGLITWLITQGCQMPDHMFLNTLMAVSPKQIDLIFCLLSFIPMKWEGWIQWKSQINVHIASNKRERIFLNQYLTERPSIEEWNYVCDQIRLNILIRELKYKMNSLLSLLKNKRSSKNSNIYEIALDFWHVLCLAEAKQKHAGWWIS